MSLEGEGLQTFGPCSWVLDERMIGFRATVFEGNSALFFEKKGNPKAGQPPLGFRATWSSRGKLAAAKLAVQLKASTKEADFAGILLKAGSTGDSDEFVEVHIHGPMTYRTCKRLVIRRDRVASYFEQAIRETAKKDLDLEFR